MESIIYHFGRKLTAVNVADFLEQESVNILYIFWGAHSFFYPFDFFNLLE
jgi:hypothetical protein